MSTKMSTKKSSDHPSYAEMISSAISSLKDRTGSSRQAIAKFVCANYKVDADKAAPHLRRALKKGVEDGVFKTARESGKGAGSYKLVVKKKKPAAKKAKPSSNKSEVGPAKKAKPSTKKSVAGAAKKKPVKKPIAAQKAKTGKKSGTSKKTKATNVIIPGKKSVTKKPKVGKNSEEASKKA